MSPQSSSSSPPTNLFLCCHETFVATQRNNIPTQRSERLPDTCPAWTTGARPSISWIREVWTYVRSRWCWRYGTRSNLEKASLLKDQCSWNLDGQGSKCWVSWWWWYFLSQVQTSENRSHLGSRCTVRYWSLSPMKWETRWNSFFCCYWWQSHLLLW